jgi:hypothetical protein
LGGKWFFGLGVWWSFVPADGSPLARGQVVFPLGGCGFSGWGAGGLSFRRMGVLWPGVRLSSLWADAGLLVGELVVFRFGRWGCTTWFVRGSWSGLLHTWVGTFVAGDFDMSGSSGKEIMGLSPGRRFLDDRSIMRLKHLAAGVSCGGGIFCGGDFSFAVGTIAWRLRGFSCSRGVPLCPGGYGLGTPEDRLSREVRAAGVAPHGQGRGG